MKVGRHRRKEPVILWGDAFSSWIGVLDELGLRPSAALLTSVDSIDLVKGAVGVDCYVGLVTDFDDNILTTLRGNCRLGLVDGRVTKKLCDLVEKLNLSCLIGTIGI
jgi:hypothetical protein